MKSMTKLNWLMGFSLLVVGQWVSSSNSSFGMDSESKMPQYTVRSMSETIHQCKVSGENCDIDLHEVSPQVLRGLSWYFKNQFGTTLLNTLFIINRELPRKLNADQLLALPTFEFKSLYLSGFVHALENEADLLLSQNQLEFLSEKQWKAMEFDRHFNITLLPETGMKYLSISQIRQIGVDRLEAEQVRSISLKIEDFTKDEAMTLIHGINLKLRAN